MSFAVSLALGAVLGLANAAAALWIAGRAGRLEIVPAMRLVLGGMMVRMAVVLLAFGLLLALSPVHQPAFIGAFAATFVLGLIAEIVSVLGRSAGSARPSANA